MMQASVVTLGGYGPPDASHGHALEHIAARLRAELGDAVSVSIDHNILDQGRPIGDLLADVEAGTTTLCYFSTSYLAERVPEVGLVDLPYLFASLAHAHAALDGTVGARLSERTAAATDLVPLGYWDNGFRHLSNRWRDVRTPEDCRGLKVRLQPNWAHEHLFRALGAEPVVTDLRDGIAMLVSGELDAQENPLANFVAYGIQALHPHLSLTAHVYGARGVYASARQLATWPAAWVDLLRDVVREAIAAQRREAEAAELRLAAELRAAGVAVLALSPGELARFEEVARPTLDAAADQLDPELVALAGRAGV